MPFTITPERPDTAEAMALIAELDAEMIPSYPPESHHGYDVQKLIREGVAFFILRVDGAAAGCGGVQIASDGTGELKRMYTRPAYRGHGLAAAMLDHLIAHARSQGVARLRLETGIHQEAALRLYERRGFVRVPPFPPYQEDPFSLFYEKIIG